MLEEFFYVPTMEVCLDFFDFFQGKYKCKLCHKKYYRRRLKPHFINSHKYILPQLYHSKFKNINQSIP